jgi:hypothetical protein
MTKLLEERRRQREEAIKLAQGYVDKISEAISLVSAILYGSFARGDFNLSSDIDVLIISDSLPSNPLARLELLYQFAFASIEPKAYTTKEFISLLKDGNLIIVDALKTGIILIDHGFLSKLKRTL